VGRAGLKLRGASGRGRRGTAARSALVTVAAVAAGAVVAVLDAVCVRGGDGSLLATA
jgi:hypothetical protein